MKIEPATIAHVAGIRALYDAMTGEDAAAFPRVDDHAFYMMDDLRRSNPQFVAVVPAATVIAAYCFGDYWRLDCLRSKPAGTPLIQGIECRPWWTLVRSN